MKTPSSSSLPRMVGEEPMVAHQVVTEVEVLITGREITGGRGVGDSRTGVRDTENSPVITIVIIEAGEVVRGGVAGIESRDSHAMTEVGVVAGESGSMRSIRGMTTVGGEATTGTDNRVNIMTFYVTEPD